MIIKKLKIILVFCTCVLYAFSEESAGGLLFTSSAEKVDKRTSLVLFGNKLQKFQNSFDISFDLSIWDSNQFGHIFRVIDNKGQEVEFVFVNFYGIDKMYLDFHSPITHKSVQIPITKESIDNKEILHLDIHFDLEKDAASILLKDSVYTCAPIGLENPSSLLVAFGIYGLNLAAPQMLVRNLHIQAANKKSFFFPLKESKGDYAYDEAGKVKAFVKNPEWVINKHYYWQSKSVFKVDDAACVSYDEGNNRILIIDKDSLICYYPRYERVESYFLGNMLNGFKMNDAIYDPLSNRYCVLGIANNKLQPINLSNDLSIDFLNLTNETNLQHHNNFFSESGDLYQFGGYANHTYSNKIFLYDKDKQEWVYSNFTGDEITPRLFSAVGDGILPDEKLIFGGFGNETGKQEHGGHNLYDLYSLDVKQKKVTNLWQIKDVPKMEFISGSNLVLSDDKTCFYALCYAHHIPNTMGYLYRFNIQDGSYDIMSDSISLISEDMNTSVNLFYNKQIKEFYAVIREFFEDRNTTIVKIYSLQSPPVSKAELDNAGPGRLYVFILLAVGVIFLSLLVFALVKFRRKERQEKKQIESLQSLQSLEEDKSDKRIKQSAVYVFSNFTVYDKNGTDISYRFSMKLRTLFALVLLNTNKDTGISTERLTSILWPDKEINEAKNIRGITIHRLRGILPDIEGISLIHQNSQWFFVFDEELFYCDYLEYSSIMKELQELTFLQDSYNDLMERLITILNNGAFLANIQDTGIDNFKSKEEDKIEQLLKSYISHLYREKQYQKVISVAPVFFMVEPLDDEVLDICLKSYKKMNKKQELKLFLKNYKKTYEMMTGEEFKINI